MDWGTEIFGLIAGVLVMLSYIFTGKKLRVINLVGSIFFVIYGIKLGGVSVVVLNGACIIIHLYYLLKEVTKR